MSDFDPYNFNISNRVSLILKLNKSGYAINLHPILKEVYFSFKTLEI